MVSGLIGLHMEGALTDEWFAISINYLALGGSAVW